MGFIKNTEKLQFETNVNRHIDSLILGFNFVPLTLH